MTTEEQEPAPANDVESDVPAPPTSRSTDLELTEASLSRDIAKLVVPMVGENLLGLAIFYTDAVMVGHLGTIPIAGVGLAMHIAFIFSFIPMGIGVACAAMVARAIGRRDPHEASFATAHAISAGGVIGVLGSLLAVHYGGRILWLLGAEPAVVEMGSLYLRWVAVAILCNTLVRIFGAALKAAGDARSPLLITACTVVLNIALNYGLIFGRFGLPRLEVRGAALATSIASAMGVLLFVILLGRSCGVLRVLPVDLVRLRLPMLQRLGKIALPSFGEIGLNQLGFLISTTLITRLGTIALATHTIAVRTEALSFIPAFAFATASGTLVGQNLGRGNQELAALSLRRTSRYAVMLMGSIGILFLLVPRQLVSIFSPEPAVLALSAACVRVSFFEQAGLAMLMTHNGALRGAGDTVSPFLVTIAGTLLIRPVLILLFAYGLGGGIVGAWIAAVFDWNVRALLAFLLFRRGRWRRIRV